MVTFFPTNVVFLTGFREERETPRHFFPWVTQLDPVKTVWPNLRHLLQFNENNRPLTLNDPTNAKPFDELRFRAGRLTYKSKSYRNPISPDTSLDSHTHAKLTERMTRLHFADRGLGDCLGSCSHDVECQNICFEYLHPASIQDFTQARFDSHTQKNDHNIFSMERSGSWLQAFWQLACFHPVMMMIDMEKENIITRRKECTPVIISQMYQHGMLGPQMFLATIASMASSSDVSVFERS